MKVKSILTHLLPQLPEPDSQIKKILLELIQSKKGIAEQDYPFNMFRGHISILRRSITIKHTDVPFTNSFGRKGTYRRHWLTDTEKVKAARYYLKMFDNKKAA